MHIKIEIFGQLNEGKTTIADIIRKSLKEVGLANVVVLDGDGYRSTDHPLPDEFAIRLREALAKKQPAITIQTTTLR